MRVPTAFPISAVLIGLVVPWSGVYAQQLPEYTTEDRWERAAMHATLFGVVILRQGMDAGRTPSEVARTMVDLAGPGWSGMTTPLAMGQAMHWNYQLWPGAEFVMNEAVDGSVTIHMNRPYAVHFGEGRAVWDVTLEDFDTMFRVFHELVAEQQGMEFRQTEDPDGLTVVIRPR